jgi:hypothetical protein
MLTTEKNTTETKVEQNIIGYHCTLCTYKLRYIEVVLHIVPRY